MTHARFFEALPFPALRIGADGRIAEINGLAEDIFGRGVSGRHYITALRQPVLLDAIEAALKLQNHRDAVYPTTRARRELTLHASVRPISSAEGVLVTFEDRSVMEEAEQMRRDFVANVSHELRTPLTALLGFVDTIKGAARDDAEARDRFLNVMADEARRMNRLVDELLSLSRVEASERQRPTADVDLVDLIRHAVATLRPLAEARDIEMVVDLPDGARLPGDADQLLQVATNLLENALKYTRDRSEVRVSVRHAENEPSIRGPGVILSVTDKGEGIAPHHIPRLTERFYRVDSHRSREMGGTGLGLSIVKHIVNRHRGRLRIVSETGVGSEFTVILPKEH